MDNIGYGRERLKNIAKKAKEKEEEQTADNIDLIATENGQALREAL